MLLWDVSNVVERFVEGRLIDFFMDALMLFVFLTKNPRNPFIGSFHGCLMNVFWVSRNLRDL